ncbi:unnamed protein product, partial [Mesorhabditis spiculigera]
MATSKQTKGTKVGKFSREEEMLLFSFPNSDTSMKDTVGFAVNSALAALTQLYFFYAIKRVNLQEGWALCTITVLVAIVLLTWAAMNLKRLLKTRILQKRKPNSGRDGNKKTSVDKKMTQKEKDERALYRRGEGAEGESTWLAIAFTNTFFISASLIISYAFLRSSHPLLQCIVTMCSAAGFVAFCSTSKK